MRPPPGSRRSHLLAIALGPLPVYAILFGLDLLTDQPYTPGDYIFYLTGISIPIIVVLLLLLKTLCRESPGDLNLKPGRWTSDLLAALVLSVVTLAANILANELVAQVLPAPSNTSILNLFAWLSGSPARLALFLGLLLWIGVAQEELTRVFLLSRLWKVWPSTTAKWLSILVAAALFGLSHYYQGPTRIVWTGLYGLIMGLYYLRFGRVAPMIISHYLTNALQVVVFAVRMPPG